MTPDIREKAERLAEAIEAGDFIVVRRGKPWLNTLAVANIISQALLEAHNAGRAEERERSAFIAETHPKYRFGAWSGNRTCHAIAGAIRAGDDLPISKDDLAASSAATKAAIRSIT